MYQVITKNSIEGFHAWWGAPHPVRFLSNQHRHIFEIRCWFDVVDPDREIEFISKAWDIEKYLEGKYGKPCMFGRMSCEMIGREIMDEFGCAKVEVLEDGDGGALVG